jgi:predicted methyltransferase
MWLPNRSQVDAASRHAITAAGVAVTIFGLQAKGVSMEQVTALINSLGETVNTLVQLVAAAGVVYGGIQAAKSASTSSQIARVQAIATGPASADAADAQKALIEATSAVAQDTTIPTSKEAKVAILDAAANLDEVKEPIKVTDPELAMATSSPLVKAA